jgi:hypothetical protein
MKDQMRHFEGIAFVVITTSVHLLSSAGQPAPLTITVECPRNPSCIFWGEDLPIKLHLRNSSQVQVGVPLEYVRKVGPYVRLIDAKSKERTNLHVSLASHDLMRVFTPLQPGESAEMSGMIYASEIEMFRKKYIDLNVEVAISAEIQLDNKQIIDVAPLGKFKIVGRDTMDRVAPDRSSGAKSR